MIKLAEIIDKDALENISKAAARLRDYSKSTPSPEELKRKKDISRQMERTMRAANSDPVEKAVTTANEQLRNTPGAGIVSEQEFDEADRLAAETAEHQKDIDRAKKDLESIRSGDTAESINTARQYAPDRLVDAFDKQRRDLEAYRNLAGKDPNNHRWSGVNRPQQVSQDTGQQQRPVNISKMQEGTTFKDPNTGETKKVVRGGSRGSGAGKTTIPVGETERDSQTTGDFRAGLRDIIGSDRYNIESGSFAKGTPVRITDSDGKAITFNNKQEFMDWRNNMQQAGNRADRAVQQAADNRTSNPVRNAGREVVRQAKNKAQSQQGVDPQNTQSGLMDTVQNVGSATAQTGQTIADNIYNYGQNLWNNNDNSLNTNFGSNNVLAGGINMDNPIGNNNVGINNQPGSNLLDDLNIGMK